MLAIPILAWSPYAIPAGSIPAAALEALRVQLGAHVLAEHVRFNLADMLYSPDQLPVGYAAIRDQARQLGEALAAGHDLKVDPRGLAQTTPFVSDVRYLVGAVLAAPGAPIFRWHERGVDQENVLADWRAQAGPTLQRLLPGCHIEPLLPGAYFGAWRRADREGRPHSLRAAVAYLQAVLDCPAGDLCAVIAPYYEQQLLEWRVGLARRKDPAAEVLHGIVWPLLGGEEGGQEGDSIAAILREAGLVEIHLPEGGFAIETCEDCGSPLFPNRDGESAHAYMPEEAGGTPAHLH